MRKPPASTQPRRTARATKQRETATASVDHTLQSVEERLLAITRRWASPTLLGGASVLATGCATRIEAKDASSAQPAPVPAAEASTPTQNDPEPARTAQSRAAEEARAAEQLLPGPKGEPVDVKTPAPGGGKPLTCREDDLLFPVRASGLSVDSAPDYLELRSLRLEGEGRSGVQDFTVLDRLGAPCATATNAQCRSQLAGPVSEASASICVQLCVGYSVVTTRGDEVKQWSSAAELRQLLGDIVTESDALLLVAAHGYQLECGNPARSTIRKLKDGFEVYATRVTNTCSPVEGTRYRLRVSRQGEVAELDKLVVSRSWDACIGREPAGLLSSPPVRGGSPLGDFLADCARLEQASEIAFRRMVVELTAHAAPNALIERARAAADDEHAHARVVGQLARARGGHVQPAQVAPVSGRALEQIALENAVEGCVRETYGALVGGYQASHALDHALRTSMSAIADDERRHAALSHALHTWLLRQLGPAARDRVQRALHGAVFALREACATLEHQPWQAQAGLPPRAVALAFVDELSRTLWEAAA